MNNKCTQVKKLLDLQIKMIEEHIDKHKWFNHMSDKNEAVIDFIDKYGWVMKQLFCEYICEHKNECNLLKKELEESEDE